MVDSDQTPLHRVLSTNIEPSSSEAHEIRRCVDKSNALLLQLDPQITEAHVVLNALLERQKAEKNLLLLYQSALSSIRRLPPDVLLEIFLFTREWGRDKGAIPVKSRTVGPRPGKKPLAITHVCADWRRIALSFPLLWNTIEARPVRLLDASGDGPFVDPRLHSWLERTGASVALDITFNGPHQWSPTGDHPTASMAWIHPWMHRVQNLTLGGRLCDLPGGNWQSLETLKIDQLELWTAQSRYAVPRPWAGSTEPMEFPSLRHVGFRGSFRYLKFIPWQRLSELYLDLGWDALISRTTITALLSQTKALVHLTIHCSIYDEDEDDEHGADERIISPAAHPYVSLVHLESLSVNLQSKTSWLLDHVTLPILAKLHITKAKAWSQSVYRVFCSRSSLPLKLLVVQGWKVDDATFVDILKRTPSLIEIQVIDAFHITPTLISAMTPGRGLLAPNLEHLHVRYPSTFATQGVLKAPVEAVRQMISSRSGEPAPPVDRPYLVFANTMLIFSAKHPKRPCGKPQIREILRKEDKLPEADILHIFF
ncbi:hypothetical protein Hypma_004880 [Hypsizygus marmoreus]|uniref:Uncharacterized protein n=1 Tax=Hypsizygus marmoreus TaxID=39966 RepID=A0A369K8K4_HYPMA|nr:hypothetical protein Hypma_004880 [Hypsizygus marmoreus]